MRHGSLKTDLKKWRLFGKSLGVKRRLIVNLSASAKIYSSTDDASYFAEICGSASDWLNARYGNFVSTEDQASTTKIWIVTLSSVWNFCAIVTQKSRFAEGP